MSRTRVGRPIWRDPPATPSREASRSMLELVPMAADILQRGHYIALAVRRILPAARGLREDHEHGTRHLHRGAHGDQPGRDRRRPGGPGGPDPVQTAGWFDGGLP